MFALFLIFVVISFQQTQAPEVAPTPVVTEVLPPSQNDVLSNDVNVPVEQPVNDSEQINEESTQLSIDETSTVDEQAESQSEGSVENPVAVPSVVNPTPTPPAIVQAPVAPPAPPSSVATAPSTGSYNFVNDLRTENLSGSIQRSALLEASAIAYGKTLAEDCQRLDHMDLSGLLEQNIDGKPINSAAENLGYNQTVNGALIGLKNSPGHFANMIGNYDYIGIGVVQSNAPSCLGRVYVVMQFAGV